MTCPRVAVILDKHKWPGLAPDDSVQGGGHAGGIELLVHGARFQVFKMKDQKVWGSLTQFVDTAKELKGSFHPSLVLLDYNVLETSRKARLVQLGQLRKRYPRSRVVWLFQTSSEFKECTGQGCVDSDDKVLLCRNDEYELRLGTVLWDLRRSTVLLEDTERPPVFRQQLLGTSPAIRQLQEDIRRSAQWDFSVLIMGETGTGKELVARDLHHVSRRRDKPFVVVHCAALSSTLFESELFGHEPHSFTGAGSHRRIGRIEEADGGIVFLDEVGDVPLEMQIRLLRFLQDKTFQRVGGNQTLTADVRIIAATHQNLRRNIADGSFREDFYYRINQIRISVSSLRERKSDIEELAQHFLQRAVQSKLSLSTAAIEELQKQDWPGNVRELQTVIIRMVVFSPHQEVLTEEDVWRAIEDDAPLQVHFKVTDSDRQQMKAKVEQSALVQTNHHTFHAFESWVKARETSGELSPNPIYFLFLATTLYELSTQDERRMFDTSLVMDRLTSQSNVSSSTWRLVFKVVDENRESTSSLIEYESRGQGKPGRIGLTEEWLCLSKVSKP